MRKIILSGLVAAVLPASAALSQDLYVYGGAALEFELAPNGAGSDNKTDINAYVEVEKSGFFAGLWAEKSSDEFSDKADVYVGYRAQTAGGLSYYVDLTRRTYFNDTGDYTVVDAGVEYQFTEQFSTSFDLFYYPDYPLIDAYVGAAFALSDKITVSANYGTYGVEDAPDQQEWDFGAGYAIGEESVFDLRYYNGTEYVDHYFGASLSWDTTFLSR